MLKASEIATLPDGPHYDSPYLYLQVRGVNRSWIMRYPRDANGKKREEGLGPLVKVSPKLAREKRDERLKQLATGINPIEAKRAAKEALANRRTFAVVANAFIEKERAKWRTSFEGRTMTLDIWKRNVERDCASFASKAIDEVVMGDIKRVIAPYWDRGTLKAGRDFLKRIELIFDFAIAHEWRTTDNPASWKRFKQLWPAQAAKMPHAALPWRDAPKFLTRVRASAALTARVLEFTILTATRSGETRGARWSEIDLDARTWTIPPSRMKMGRKNPLPHVVPLSTQAIALLERVRAEGVEGDLIFPGYINDGSRRRRAAFPVPNANIWRLSKRLGGNVDITTHGFRSTFRDWCGNRRVDRDLAERSLAHQVGSAVEEAYARDRLIELRAPIMQAWADFLDGVEVSNVVPLKAA